MKYVRFYLEFATPSDKRKGKHEGNCIAVSTEPYDMPLAPVPHFEAIGAVYYYPNSPCASTGVSREFLRTKCKRISEAQAHEIHPQLFAYLDQ